MDFTDDAFVLSARAHGDTGVVVELLTETHGRRAAYVAGGASRRMKPFLQAGLGEGDVGTGLDLTAHFLEQFVFHPQNKPIPPARVWMIDKLREAGRL